MTTTSAGSELPDTIRTFLAAHAARDTSGALATLAPDVVITDQDERYVGLAGARDFVQGAGSEFTYTTTRRGVRAAGADRWVVTHRLAGNFPGGVADLEYAFALDGDLITQLTIT